MLSPDQRQRIAVVLVRARNPQNIGAAARAMHDFGFADLRLVNPYPVPLEAARSAIDASDVLRSARSFPELSEAVHDCTLVFGTTAVGERRLEHPLQTLAQGAERIATEIAEALALPSGAETDDLPETESLADTEDFIAGSSPRVALLFGSEKTGLSNEELSHCHALLTIPMQLHAGLRHPSMNLGQAVAVCLYELIRGTPIAPRGSAGVAATAHDTERLRELVSEVLEMSEYRRHHPANSTDAHLRRLVLRLAPDRADTPVWMGMMRQILWKLRHPETRS